jgi:hypothetical protein
MVVSLAMLVGALSMGASPAYAGAACPPDPTPGSTIDASLRVSSGTCTLNGVTVTGSVSVSAGAVLITKDAAITGNVTATGANVKIEGGSIHGFVVLIDPPRLRLCNVTIDGGLVIQDRVTGPTGAALPACTTSGPVVNNGTVVLRNNSLPVGGGGTVRGDLVISGNMATISFGPGQVSGGAYITNNRGVVNVVNSTVGGLLFCAGNFQPPNLAGTTAGAINCS